MIQRKQSLFLIELIFLGLALLFIPCQSIITANGASPVFLQPLVDFQSTAGHYAAIAINFLALVLSTVTIFSFKRRALQVRLCYVLIVLWVILTAMMLFCPFVVKTDAITAVNVNYFVAAIGFFAIVAAYFAAHFIKKDIDLLKSADRIR